MNYVSQENLDNIVKGLSNKIAMSVSNGALIGDTTPVGTVISFMGTQAPLYYLVCDGTTYNIEEYQELADFIEAQFGAVNYFGGDGVDTFAVPDLRGEFLRGTGTNSHENQGDGANVGVHQDGKIGTHAHVIPSINTNSSNLYGWKGSWPPGEADPISDDPEFGAGFTRGANETSGTTAYSSLTWATKSGHTIYDDIDETRPTNTSVLYCIKYTKAVVPSEYEDGTPIGRVIFDSILREGYIKANGAQIEDASISIPRLLSFVQKYSSQLIASDQATYEANVGLYMYDSNNDILTLPNYIGRFMEGGNSVESIEAGLPNIKGMIATFVWKTSAGNYAVSEAIQAPDSATVSNHVNFVSGASNSQYVDGEITFDASQSNPIYSDTVNTVQPSSITLIPQIRY